MSGVQFHGRYGRVVPIRFDCAANFHAVAAGFKPALFLPWANPVENMTAPWQPCITTNWYEDADNPFNWRGQWRV